MSGLLLEGKVAVISGSTRGIGRAMAETFFFVPCFLKSATLSSAAFLSGMWLLVSPVG